MKKTLTAIALVAAIGIAGAAHASTDSNWTVSNKGECRLSSGGVIPDLDHTPVFVNFIALGNRTEVSLGGSAVRVDGGGSDPKIALVTEDPPTATSGVYQPQWGINGPAPFLLSTGVATDQFFAHAEHAKTLHVLIERMGDYPVSLAGFEVARAQFDDCKIRRGH